MLVRPTSEEVERALEQVTAGRAEPYPFWKDAEHVLAAEVIALRAQLERVVTWKSEDGRYFLSKGNGFGGVTPSRKLFTEILEKARATCQYVADPECRCECAECLPFRELLDRIDLEHGRPMCGAVPSTSGMTVENERGLAATTVGRDLALDYVNVVQALTELREAVAYEMEMARADGRMLVASRLRAALAKVKP